MFILIIFKKSKTTGKIMEIHWSNCVQTPVEKLFITKNIKQVVSINYDQS